MTLRLDEAAKLAEFFADSCHALGHGFEFESQLPTLPAEGLNLETCIGDLTLQAAAFAVRTGEALFGLGELVPELRGPGHRIKHGGTGLFLLTFELGQPCGCVNCFLLRQR